MRQMQIKPWPLAQLIHHQDIQAAEGQTRSHVLGVFSGTPQQFRQPTTIGLASVLNLLSESFAKVAKQVFDASRADFIPGGWTLQIRMQMFSPRKWMSFHETASIMATEPHHRQQLPLQLSACASTEAQLPTATGVRYCSASFLRLWQSMAGVVHMPGCFQCGLVPVVCKRCCSPVALLDPGGLRLRWCVAFMRRNHLGGLRLCPPVAVCGSFASHVSQDRFSQPFSSLLCFLVSGEWLMVAEVAICPSTSANGGIQVPLY